MKYFGMCAAFVLTWVGFVSEGSASQLTSVPGVACRYYTSSASADTFLVPYGSGGVGLKNTGATTRDVSCPVVPGSEDWYAISVYGYVKKPNSGAAVADCDLAYRDGVTGVSGWADPYYTSDVGGYTFYEFYFYGSGMGDNLVFSFTCGLPSGYTILGTTTLY